MITIQFELLISAGALDASGFARFAESTPSGLDERLTNCVLHSRGFICYVWYAEIFVESLVGNVPGSV